MRSTKMDKKQIKYREKNYVSRWNVDDGKKDYDALDDVYASNYFIMPNVTKHLRYFSKVARKQPKTCDLLRMTFLVKQKYSLGDNKKKLTKNKSRSSIEELKESVIRPYYNDLKPESLQKLNRTSSNLQQEKKMRRYQSNGEKLPKVSNHRKFYQSHNEQASIQKQTDKLEFDKFLQKKKKQNQKRD